MMTHLIARESAYGDFLRIWHSAGRPRPGNEISGKDFADALLSSWFYRLEVVYPLATLEPAAPMV
jgi:hypothetical protein